jgi:hypothetical protein
MAQRLLPPLLLLAVSLGTALPTQPGLSLLGDLQDDHPQPEQLKEPQLQEPMSGLRLAQHVVRHPHLGLWLHWHHIDPTMSATGSSSASHGRCATTRTLTVLPWPPALARLDLALSTPHPATNPPYNRCGGWQASEDGGGTSARDHTTRQPRDGRRLRAAAERRGDGADDAAVAAALAPLAAGRAAAAGAGRMRAWAAITRVLHAAPTVYSWSP